MALGAGVMAVVLAAVFYGSRIETTTEVKPPPAPTPTFSQVSPASAAPSAPAAAFATAGDAPASLPGDTDMQLLRARALALPVQGVAAAQLSDTYTQARAAGAPHEALDIMAARGTPVLAVEDGQVAKLFLSKPGGITIYQFDPSSQYAYYYAHLDRYADGVREGSYLRKGQVIAYVGSTGNASPDAPHLHFAIFRLGPERQWWRGTPLNPFLIWRDQKP
jgi:murein DD-endopeptidase MepM/ murein hydrolase activator NlpD